MNPGFVTLPPGFVTLGPQACLPAQPLLEIGHLPAKCAHPGDKRGRELAGRQFSDRIGRLEGIEPTDERRAHRGDFAAERLGDLTSVRGDLVDDVELLREPGGVVPYVGQRVVVTGGVPRALDQPDRGAGDTLGGHVPEWRIRALVGEDRLDFPEQSDERRHLTGSLLVHRLRVVRGRQEGLVTLGGRLDRRAQSMGLDFDRLAGRNEKVLGVGQRPTLHAHLVDGDPETDHAGFGDGKRVLGRLEVDVTHGSLPWGRTRSRWRSWRRW